MCEYWLFLFSIHWEYWLLGLETPYRDLPLQEFFIWDFSLFSDERHQQLAVVHHHSLNQIRKTLNSPRFPHFVCQIQFTSTSPGTEKQQKRGKGEICSEGCCRGRRWGKKRDVQSSFLWTKESVVQMFEGKQENYLSVGAVPHWKAVLYWKFKAVYYS